MDTGQEELRNRVYRRLIAAPVVIGLMLFVPAGSLSYWQGWLYLGVIFVPLMFAVGYFLKNDKELLERRMKLREKEGGQKRIVLLSSVVFLAGFLLPGLDYRFGWSEVPVALVLTADAIVFLGYLITFLTLRENSFASRIIEVEVGQQVISTGPYAIVRHPMYAGVILMFLFTPLALGSSLALVAVVPLAVLIVLRIRNEETVLARELPGYVEYCGKVRYRLVPGIW
jgi:protein-S-isoprenylcysteine O-methyltransferase Ste14